VISELYRSGMKPGEIARQLDLATTTVSYHVERIDRGEGDQPLTESLPPACAPASKTREAVVELLAQGLAKVEIARRLGVSKSTVSYHVRCLGKPIDERFGKRYDWNAVQRYYDAGHSVRECMRAFGFSSASWSDAVKRGAVVGRPSATPISELLVAGKYRGRKTSSCAWSRKG
jgi:DNA-binding CsgD family transcriptional regulator